MYVDHITLSGTLTVTEDLHIGTGEERRDLHKDVKRCQMVMRNNNGQPVIPPTSLKGAVRSACRLSGTDDAGVIKTMFGATDEDRDTRTGAMGRLWFHTAVLAETSKSLAKTQGLPFADVDQAGPGAFVKTRTAIDRASGGPDEHKLFSAEWVPQGANFTWSATWHSAAETIKAFQDNEQAFLVRALAPLAAHGGCALGKSGGRSGGRVELDLASLSLEWHHLDRATGEFTKTALDKATIAGFVKALRSAADDLRKQDMRRIKLTLSGISPFISINPATMGNDENNTLNPLERDNKPALWTSSLLGALRDRASWLVECARARGETSPAYLPAERCSNSPADDRFKNRKSIGTLAEVKALSSVERLFGVPGWRGHVAVESLRCTDADAGSVTFAGVSVDRFTGGHRDTFLFNTKVHINPEFTLTLAIDLRHLTQADTALIECLLDDLCAEGAEPLFLGHGASKGLGWFKVCNLHDNKAGEST